MSTSKRSARLPVRSAPLAALLAATPARLAIGRTGPRLPATAYLAMVADHARARDAITSEVPAAFVRKLGLTEVSTRARSREEYVRLPALGRTLDATAVARLRRCRQRPEVQLALTDGLSSAAIVANGGAILRPLRRHLLRRGRRLGTPLFVRNGRVRVQDEIGAVLRPEVFCFLVGERPGLATAESVSAYVIYRPTRRSAEPDRTVISNIHRGGVAPTSAARQLADLIDEILEHGASGAALAAARARDGLPERPSR
jgi:ethanolamine ammonia-lyase small subunit